MFAKNKIVLLANLFIVLFGVAITLTLTAKPARADDGANFCSRCYFIDYPKMFYIYFDDAKQCSAPLPSEGTGPCGSPADCLCTRTEKGETCGYTRTRMHWCHMAEPMYYCLWSYSGSCNAGAVGNKDTCCINGSWRIIGDGPTKRPHCDSGSTYPPR